MKTKQLIILTTALIFSLLVSSCKYEDGPVLSLRSVKSRLKGTWVIEKYLVDNQDSTQLYIDSCGCSFVFYTNGTSDLELIIENCIKDTAILYTTTTEYKLTNNNKTITMSYNSGINNLGPIGRGDIISYTISKLTKKNLWLSINYNNNFYKLYFSKL